jgi:hypothetical protein
MQGFDVSSRLYRLCPKTGARQFAIRDAQGFYVLGSPARGAEKHYEKNKVLTKSEDEMIDLVAKGYSVRVRTDAAPSLVRLNLHLDGVKFT